MFLATIAAFALNVPSVKTAPPLRAEIGPQWAFAAHLTLQHELNYRVGNRGEMTDVYVEADAQALYIAFSCKQRAPIVAEQHSDNSGVEGDDYVTVKLWPGGPNGVAYSFSSTPIGIHDQSSSENTAFAPHWDSVGQRTGDGYTVVMRIPRNVLHGDGRKDWPVNFARYIQKESLRLVWAWDSAMSYSGDPTYAGLARSIGGGEVAAAKPRARFQPYVLAQTNVAAVQGTASRAGFDFSLPIAKSTSLYGTVHPDYSEVERDQQTIAPSQFAYRYTEVRPFFTQGANYFDNTTLYTPAIPTPRYGYAMEGTARGYTYAAFDAIGHNGRDDNAQTLSWTSENRHYAASAQRVISRYRGFSDAASSYSVSAGNGKHFGVFAEIAHETGTNVTDPTQGSYGNLGVNLYAPNKNFYIAKVDYGAQFSPADAYVTYVDAHGYQSDIGQQFHFTDPHAKLDSISVSWYADRYKNSAGQVNQTDSYLYASLQNKHQLTVNLNFDTTRGLNAAYGMVPYDQSGIYVYDGANLARTVGIGYFAGHFYNGYLQSISPSISLKLRPKEAVSAYESRYIFRSKNAVREVQRLDVVSYSYQYSTNGSLAAAIRWIDGSPAYFVPETRVHETNLSISINQRFAGWHAYLVYGDPNVLSTVHSIILKVVRFVGADEGT